MKSNVVTTISPHHVVREFHNPRPQSRIVVQVIDILDVATDQARSVGLKVATSGRNGTKFHLNVHPMEVDSLVEQLRLAELAAFRRHQELFPDTKKPHAPEAKDLLDATRALLYSTSKSAKKGHNKDQWKDLERAVKKEVLRRAAEETRLETGWYKSPAKLER